MTENIESIVDRCLNEIEQGKSIEYCLSLYPEYGKELEPLLRLGERVRGKARLEPNKEALNLALIRMGETLAMEKKKRRFVRRSFNPLFIWKPALAKAVGFALIFVVVIWSMGALSTKSIPGNPLYSLKLATERVRFSLARNPEGRAELRLTLSDRRLDELVRSFQATGNLNDELLKKTLREAELALDEAKPVGEEHYRLFLARLNSVNEYQQTVLEELRTRATAKQDSVLGRAIQKCRQRSGCMMDMMHQGNHGMKNREWHAGCRGM